MITTISKLQTKSSDGLPFGRPSPLPHLNKDQEAFRALGSASDRLNAASQTSHLPSFCRIFLPRQAIFPGAVTSAAPLWVICNVRGGQSGIRLP